MAYKSKIKIFNLPLIHISLSEPAVGFIAIGQFAYGFFTLAQFGVGIIFGFGQFMVGAISISQFSLGTAMSIGQFAIGWYSIGMFAVGFEGIHLLGYHYIKRNFLSSFIGDWKVFFHNLIFLAIFIVLVAVINLIFNIAYKVITSGISKKKSAMKNDNKKNIPNSKLSIKISKSIKFIFFFISLFAIWHYLSVTRIAIFSNKTDYNKIEKVGKKAVAEILEIKDLDLNINKNHAVLLKVKVTPDERETEPFIAVIRTSLSKVRLLKTGDRISVKYDPYDHKKVIWIY